MNQEAKAIKAVRLEQSVNHSTKKSKPAITTRVQQPWRDSYKDTYSYETKPVNEGFIERLAKDFIDWSRTPEAFRISDFHWDKNICDGTFYDWIKKFEVLNLAHKQAKNNLARRREVGAIKKEFAEATATRALYLLDPVWKQMRQDDIDTKTALTLLAIQEKAKAEGNDKRAVNVSFYDYPETPKKFLQEEIAKNLE